MSSAERREFDEWKDPHSRAGELRRVVQQIVGNVIAENDHAKKAHDAMVRSGLTSLEARAEVARVLLAGIWTAERELPIEPFEALMDRLAAGERSTDIFPEEDE